MTATSQKTIKIFDRLNAYDQDFQIGVEKDVFG